LFATLPPGECTNKSPAGSEAVGTLQKLRLGSFRLLSRCHFPAFFSTAVTGLSTFLAVLMLMFCTFITTFLAHLSANFTNLSSEFTVHSHELSGQAADAGALHVRPDTFAHHLQIFFLQTGRCAVVTGCGTDITGLNAIAILFRHLFLSSSVSAKK